MKLLFDDLGRKFLWAILGATIALVLVFTGKISGDAYLNFYALLGGTFLLGNIAEKAVNKMT